ncbi:hypothetical protein [Methylocystis sp. B8]|uniref:hypothetical protein n=1 Tax=Methylocystis sp. B8 TaxID=544938 RepID=UPI0010FD7FE4|nr:hypothetical protein [Methylocystis sp. B8]TLG75164.1 hypothetical protein FEV16_11690 [Methylocystis sp. B8]
MGDLSLEDFNTATASTVLAGRSEADGSFNGDVVLAVEAQTLADHAVAGIRTVGQGAPALLGLGQGAPALLGLSDNAGVVGVGTAGVIGRTDNKRSRLPPTFDNVGVLGSSFGDQLAAGMIGESDVGYGVYAVTTAGTGVRGDSDNVGVMGSGLNRFGVVGQSLGSGVFGLGGTVGVRGQADRPACNGVWGSSDNGIGVLGTSLKNVGVYGQCGARPRTPGVAAGFFVGPVIVVGSFTAYGAKSAAVPCDDGTYRLLYAVESPESWFEDFGDAQLESGKARVDLDPKFASCIKAKGYHVFLTACSDCNGLYVSRRDKTGFEVRESQRGKSNARFSFRIVGKRKDISAERFASAPSSNDLLKAVEPSLKCERFKMPEQPKRRKKRL